MHELGVTQDILKQVLNALEIQAPKKQNQAGKEATTPAITKITLTIGKFNQLVAENVAYYFGVLAKGTAASNAELIINSTPMKAKCTTCQHTFVIEGFNFLCPDCGGFAGELITGKELRVDSIEISDK